MEREKAKQTYAKEMSEGLTGVISYSDEDLENKKLLRIMLGNFPP